MPSVFVIAEAGISHDGDLRKAFELIDHAKAAKADAVKFQTFNAKRLCQRRGKPELDLILKPYEMPLEWLPLLKDHSDKAGIEFMTTCFDEETVSSVAPFVRRFKIGHGEIGDQSLLDACVAYGKPIIRSIPDGKRVVLPKRSAMISNLYVTTKYPTPSNEASLELVRFFDGFSDHTRNVYMGSWAVAAGAKIVEVHFRDFYTSYDNLDWAVSHDPLDLLKYVALIRQAESAVYGAASEETKKLERPESAPRTSHLPASEEYDLPGDLPITGC